MKIFWKIFLSILSIVTVMYLVFGGALLYASFNNSLKMCIRDRANALMAIPNLICLLALSGVIAKEVERFQPEVDKAKRKNK